MVSFEKNTQIEDNFIQVEKNDGKEDKLKFNKEKFEKFINNLPDDIEKKYESQIKKYEKAIEETVSTINSRLEGLIKVMGNSDDMGRIIIEDGEDTQYLAKLAKNFNESIKGFIIELKENNEAMVDLAPLSIHSYERYATRDKLENFLKKIHEKNNIPTNSINESDNIKTSNNSPHKERHQSLKSLNNDNKISNPFVAIINHKKQIDEALRLLKRGY